MFGRVTDITRCMVIQGLGEDRNRTINLLQDLGFDVSGSRTMDEALCEIEVRVPEIILLDARADARKTSAAVMRLKEAARRRGKSPSILMCAETADPSEISAAIVHGASECLVKPFDDAILENKLKQCGLV